MMLDTKIMVALEEFVQNKLAPMVAGHGGTIAIDYFDGKTLKISLGGACGLCVFDSQTKDWVQHEVIANFPQISECLVEVVKSEKGLALP